MTDQANPMPADPMSEWEPDTEVVARFKAMGRREHRIARAALGDRQPAEKDTR